MIRDTPWRQRYTYRVAALAVVLAVSRLAGVLHMLGPSSGELPRRRRGDGSDERSERGD